MTKQIELHCSYRGPGLEKGLEILAKVKEEFDLPMLPISYPEEARLAAEG
jgi:2-dehydro-3-deoxyphosphooctonate aldolase (KDO 8-P synthase)